MNAKTDAWSRRYRTALSRYLQPESSADLRPAAALGRSAVTLEMETLDVVRVHEQAIATLVAPDGSPRNLQKMIVRARRFFVEATVPIEKTHRAALKAEARVNRLTQALRQRTRDASATDLRLKRGITRRRAAEAALKKSEARRTKLLAEACRLQTQLRDLPREILSAQEGERRTTSRQLQDEVSQALLAINILLLTLNMAAKTNTRDLKKEIAETQRLVRESAKIIRRLTP